MRCRWLGLMAILGIVSFPLVALQEVTYLRSPSDTVLVFRAFILSMFPIQGHFRVFWWRTCASSSQSGFLHGHDQGCNQKPLGARHRDPRERLAPSFLGPKADPFMDYDGPCAQDRLAGTLTLHEQTHQVGHACQLGRA